MNGVLIINKPANMTSRDVVNHICKVFHTKKVGHTGTLDPLATGVLIVCIGKYTKLVDLLTSYDKEYLATMKLGIETDTYDITGQVLKKENVNISPLKIKEVFANFPKTYEQEVPKFSAVKIGGKKLYEYAREKQEVILPKRKVNIYDLQIKSVKGDLVTFTTKVSKGTYIRSLVMDLAQGLGTVATMSKLCRIKQGSFSIKQAISLNEITIDTELLTLKDLFSYPCLEITDNQYKQVLNGNILKLNREEQNVFLTYQNEIIAIYTKKENGYYKVFAI